MVFHIHLTLISCFSLESVEALHTELKFAFNLRLDILCIIPVSGFHNELCGLVLHVLARETHGFYQHAIHSDLLLPA
jgi:hypothetical protein